MKVGIIGDGRRGLGGRMLAMLTAGFGQVARYSGKAPSASGNYRDSKGKLRFSWPILPRSADKRHWHDRSDPVQAARIQAAVAKRERKAQRRELHAERSTNGWLWTREPLLSVSQISTFDQNHVNY